jgi:hypothetical protein
MKRALLLCGTLGFIALVLLLALTPIAWQASGRQLESYPELYYVAYGWPAALALILVSAAHWRSPNQTSLAADVLVWIGTAVITWLCLVIGWVTLAMMLRLETAGAIASVVGISGRYFYPLVLAAVVSVILGIMIRRLLGRLRA